MPRDDPATGASRTALPLGPHERLFGDCSFCPKMCRHACPVAEAEASEAATPAWKGALIRLHAEGRLPLAGAVAEAAYKCTDCLLERTYCLHGHATPPAYVAVRTRAVAAGVAPAAALSYVERVRRLANPFGPSSDMRAELAAALPPGAPLLADGAPAEVAFFPGCAAVARAPDVVRHGLAVLSRVEAIAAARRDLVVPCLAAGAGCCGYPLLSGGDLEGFRALAARLHPQIAGARTIVSPDPGCVFTLNVLWKEHAAIDLGGRATTLVERLAGRLDAVRAAIRHEAAGRFAYHDPCFLGRRRGVYDEPRALLAAACGGRPPLELATAREGAWCSGAGGVYAKIWPERADRIRERRTAELAETGAARLATACPSCVRTFRKGLPPARVADVATVLAEAMELG
jgi:Fe-S oxidoreductase